jgi:methylmalonyl-CoA epimerase
MAQIKRVDHIAIAVKDIDIATQQYIKLLNAKPIRTLILEEKAGTIKVSIIQLGENLFSLIQSVDADGFLNQHIAKHGEGLHHVGLEVDNLEEFVRDVESKGFKVPLRDEFSNRKEVILRPKDSAGVILQIMEWKGGESDVTAEDRIQRFLKLQNIPKDE